MNFKRKQGAVQAVVTPGAARTSRTQAINMNLYNPDGTPYVPLVASVAVHQAATTAADLTAMKADFNALLTKLQNAGQMATS